MNDTITIDGVKREKAKEQSKHGWIVGHMYSYPSCWGNEPRECLEVIDNLAYVSPHPRANGSCGYIWISSIKDLGPKEPAKQKQDIRDYCREHRVWAAKDDPDVYGWYVFKNKPMKGQRIFDGNPLLDQTLYARANCTFPDCPWDKSLIAPDGSMPPMEQKEKTAARRLTVGDIVRLRSNKIHNGDFVYGPEHTVGVIEKDEHDGQPYLVAWKNGHSHWYREGDLEPNTATKTLPKRGDPVFVWDDNFDPRCPAVVLYFYRETTQGKTVCFTPKEFGQETDSQKWDHYRPFDPALVGVPRKDWKDA